MRSTATNEDASERIRSSSRRLLAIHRWVTDHQGQLVERLGQLALHESPDSEGYRAMTRCDTLSL